MMKKMTKFIGTLPSMMYLMAANVSANEAWTAPSIDGADGNVSTIMGKIAAFVKPIAAILVFASVLMIGFEIIMKRNKADDRMNSMTSLMWVGIGTLVIAFAALIASMLFSVAG